MQADFITKERFFLRESMLENVFLAVSLSPSMRRLRPLIITSSPGVSKVFTFWVHFKYNNDTKLNILSPTIE